MNLRDLAIQQEAEKFRAAELERQQTAQQAWEAEQARIQRERHAAELRAQLKGK